jgi:hypothetical protein
MIITEGGKISLLLSSLLILPLSGLVLQTDLFDGVESVIQAIIGIFSLLLLALSILAYKRSGLKKIIFAAIAFSLFAVQLLLDSIEETFIFLEDPPIMDVLSSSMTLAILILFFLAIVRKNS